jgi:exopolysaccharide biosynthesis predicted pyruvyltransferase EpsI
MSRRRVRSEPDSAAARPDLLAQLRQQVVSVLDELVPQGTQCALVDFPNFSNVGDSAMWLGERALLREARVSIVYVCDVQSFLEEELAERLPMGTILLHGGGNLGDLWPDHQQLRERVISAFPRHRIIQLPQSIHFSVWPNLDRARAVFDAHPDLTLLVRDHRSLQVARKEFQARSVLSPDFAFGITELPGQYLPQHRILWLARNDHEAAGQTLLRLGPGVHLTDWTGDAGADPAWLEQLRATEQDRQAATAGRRLAPDATQALCRAYDRRAELQVLRGCRLLGSGRVVITDRLHGHLICMLLGLPHVLLADRHGKLRNCWDTWTAGWPMAKWADSPQEALDAALSMIGDDASESGA